MGFGQMLKELWDLATGMDKPLRVPSKKPLEMARYAARQFASVAGQLAESEKAVAFYTMDKDFAQMVSDIIKVPLRRMGYLYYDSPSVDKGIESRVVIYDVRQESDARLHGTYAEILRQKKSMSKRSDVMAAIGPREEAVHYPRGTYPGLLYFCYDPDHPEKRDPDIPLTGRPVPAGATLYKFADIVEVLKTALSRPRPRNTASA